MMTVTKIGPFRITKGGQIGLRKRARKALGEFEGIEITEETDLWFEVDSEQKRVYLTAKGD